MIRAVDNVSFAVEDGELLVLVGPSGCGKTTTLRLIAGLEEASGGSISMDGRVVNEVPAQSRDVAMVFQNHALYPHMSVFQNLAFGLTVRKCPGAEVERRVKEAAELLGLTECLGRRPEELSGGQRQRVAVGRAIVLRPKVFLLDEPLSNLDPHLRQQLREEIAQLHGRLAATMIYVTHDQIEALTLGERIVVMRAGVVQQVAHPMEVYRKPANLFVAGLFGSPPMNLFRGMVVSGADGLVFREQAPGGEGKSDPFTVPLPKTATGPMGSYVGKHVVLGVRPEDIALYCAADPPRRNGTVDAVVRLVQPLGPETHIRLDGGAHSFVVRAGSQEQPPVSQRVSVAFDMNKASFFDAATDKAIDW